MPDDPASISIAHEAPRSALNSSTRAARPPGAVYRALPDKARHPDSLDELKDIELDIRIELGRVRMRIEEVLRLGRGSVIELNRPADGIIDIYANDRLIARGELVVLRDEIGVRIVEVIAAEAGL